MRPLDVADLHKGDVVYECFQGGSYQTRLLTEPVFNDDAWTFRGETIDGEMDYLQNIKYKHYGPKFYTEPIYLPVFDLAKDKE